MTAVKAMVEEDARVTVTRLSWHTTWASHRGVSFILHEKLRYSKVCARWLSHMLTQDQKRVRVDWGRQMPKRFNAGASNGVRQIVSGDETWVYTFEPDTKQQWAQRTLAGAAPPVKC